MIIEKTENFFEEKADIVIRIVSDEEILSEHSVVEDRSFDIFILGRLENDAVRKEIQTVINVKYPNCQMVSIVKGKPGIDDVDTSSINFLREENFDKYFFYVLEKAYLGVRMLRPNILYYKYKNSIHKIDISDVVYIERDNINRLYIV